MKRTLSINLSGLEFTIDEDAYQNLNEYLRKLESHFTEEEKKEILSDIEQRISELLTGRLGSKRKIVDIEDINYVIQTLGNPDEFEDENSDTSPAGDAATEKRNIKHRKYYRDTENQILGGVASGLASYLGWDVTIIRLILILILIVGFGYIIPAYLIVWLVAPAATSTAQKLEMKGIEPSIENIRKYIQSEEFKTSAKSIGNRLGQIFMWFCRFIAIFVGIFLTITFMAIIVGIIFALIFMILSGGVFINNFFPYLSVPQFMILAVTTLLCLIIPIAGLIKLTIRLVRNKKEATTTKHSALNWILIGVWIVSFITLIACIVSINFDFLNDNVFNDNGNNTIQISERQSENEDFSNVSISGNVQAILIADSIQYVEIKSKNSNAIKSVECVNSEDCISIYRTNTNFTNKWGRPIVEIHYKEIKSIEVNAAATVSNNSLAPIISDKLTITASSAAKTDLNVQCNELMMLATSAAKVEISGRSKKLNVSATSAAKVNAEKLQAEKAEALGNSAAKIEICADTISATSSYAANIECNCYSEILHKSVNSGGTIDLND